MSVKKIFWEDPYLTRLDAKVTSIDNNVITLDQTIAYCFIKEKKQFRQR